MRIGVRQRVESVQIVIGGEWVGQAAGGEAFVPVAGSVVGVSGSSGVLVTVSSSNPVGELFCGSMIERRQGEDMGDRP